MRALTARGRIVRNACCALALFMLSACYPDLDWRELRSAEGGFAVMFPARPKEATREMKLGGTALRMHMLRAEVNGMAFGVGYADLPAGVSGEALQAAARGGLVRNIEGRVVLERAVEASGLHGQEFRAEGVAGEKPMVLAARLLSGAGRYYQVLFIGPRERAAEVDLDFYLGSFRRL